MRFIGLLLVLISIPIFYHFFGPGSRHRRYAWFGIGLLPFIGFLNIDVAIIAWPVWPGYVKGLIVGLIDTLALVLFITTKDRSGSRPLLALFLALFVASTLPLPFAEVKQAGFFQLWQAALTIFLFATVSKVAMSPAARARITAGLACGMAVQAFMSVDQRLHGVTQASGSFGHQNLLGMTTHFVLFSSLAVLLAGGIRRMPMIGLGASLIAVMLTGSRATVGLAGAGVLGLLALSILRRPTPRKSKAAFGAVLCLAMAAPVAFATLQTRYESGPIEGSNEERVAFERAAWAILADHPMGVGANQYVVVANTQGYSERAGVIWNYTSRSAHVHNTYLLIAAEMGWLGLFAFIALLGGIATLGLKLAWARPRDSNGELALGLAFTVIIVAIHSLYEWVFVSTVIQYLLAICAGMIAGIAKQRSLEAKMARRARRQLPETSATPEPDLAGRRPVFTR